MKRSLKAPAQGKPLAPRQPDGDRYARVAAAIAGVTGEHFFDALTACLVVVLDAQACFVAERLPERPDVLRTLAVSAGGEKLPDFEYEHAAAPCTRVLEGVARIERGGPAPFVRHALSGFDAIGCYVGVPLTAADGSAVGVLVVLYAGVHEDGDGARKLLARCSARAGTELERLRHERALRQSEQSYRAVFEHGGDGICILRDGRFVECNEASLKLYRATREELLGKSPGDISPEYQPSGHHSRALVLEKLRHAEHYGTQTFEWRHRRLDGSEFDAEVMLTPISLLGVQHYVAAVRDISARKRTEQAILDFAHQLEASYATLRAIHLLSRRLNDCTDDQQIARETLTTVTSLADAPVGIFMHLDREAGVLRVLAQMDLRQGMLREHVGTLPLERSLSGLAIKSGRIVFAEDYCNDPRISPALQAIARADDCVSSVAIPLTYGTDIIGCLALDYRARMTGSRQRLEDFATIGSTVSLALTNARHRRQLEFRALHDSLTDLPNRQVLHRTFAERSAREGALMLLDLDRFKEINDTLGHAIGDRLLCEIGPRLYAALGTRPGTLCRLGGDEFTLLVPGLTGRDAALALGFRLLDALRQPFAIDGMQLEIGGSLGIALYPQDGDDSHALLRYADVAMYQAKHSGAGVVVYDRQFDRHTPERLAMITEFGQALREHQLLLHYQPRLDLRDMRVTGFEALVRWQHPRLGFLMPQDFMPLLEMSDAIHGLTVHVMELAVAEQQRWRAAGRAHAVSVNLSARNLVDDRCVRHLNELILRHELPPGALELEITETTLMHDPEGARELLASIAGRGVELSIDDYGTGYSSLAYLRRLPIRALKIDRAFVRDMRADEHDRIIVRSTINLAHNLGLQVVAEGVEDLRTLALLREMGCYQAQGYGIARPMASEAIDDWLATWRSPWPTA
ncbi:MAG TPA: EAL domain-containing protein [Gammaproteobacteria bacterium]|nr:EAL domain-containing protein [Gammaproteobacteria bacterium]